MKKDLLHTIKVGSLHVLLIVIIALLAYDIIHRFNIQDQKIIITFAGGVISYLVTSIGAKKLKDKIITPKIIKRKPPKPNE